MKFISQLSVTAAVCFLLQYFLPWWTMAIGAFMMGYLFDNGGFRSFAAGLLGNGALWLLMAGYIDYQTDSILTGRVGRILPLSPLLLASLVGGLVGGFAALTGGLLRQRRKYRADRYR